MATTEPMVSTPKPTQKTGSSPGSFMLLVFGLLVSSDSLAELDAGIRLGISHTDNLFLSPAGEERADWIFNMSPFIRWSEAKPAYEGLLDYRYDRLAYADYGQNQSWHLLNAMFAGKALEESLRLEVGASRRQVLQRPEDEILPGRAPVSGNLSDLDQWYVEPSFRRTFGGSNTLLLRYRYTESEIGDLGEQPTQTAQSSQSQNAQFSFDNYASGEGLTWALRYTYNRVDYDNESFLPFEYHNAGAQLGFWAGTNLRFFAGAGKESPWDDPVNRTPEDPFWEAGFAYQAGDKINVEAAAGERSFGESLRASVAYNFRRGSTSLSYREAPVVAGFNRQRGRIPLNPTDPDDFLTNPARAERFVSNRFDWDLTLQGRRTEFRLAIFLEQRTGQFAADGTPIPDAEQRSTNARFSWELGRRTSLDINGTYIERRQNVEQQEDQVLRARVAINYQVGAATTVSVQHQYTQQTPGDFATVREYTANITSIFVTFSLLQK